MPRPDHALSLPIVVAFAIVYLVWGSTYLANIVAIETIPPFLLVLSRLCTAGLILLGLSGLQHALRLSRADAGARARYTWPSPRQWRNLAVTSFLFLTVGLGAVVWAEQYIESGTTALLVAAEPLLVVLVLWGFDRRRPRWQALVGVALGIVGTAILVGQDVVIAGEGALWGLGAIVLAISAWAVGSVLTSRVSLPQNRLQTAGLQMLLAGLLTVPLMLASDNLSDFSLAAVSERSAWAWVFLVVLGSVVAYSAFLYLLQRVSAEKVASSTYVHPVVALTLGVVWRGEVVTPRTLVACAVLLLGVLFVNGNWGGRREAAAVQPRQGLGGAIRRVWEGRPRAGKGAGLRRSLGEAVVPELRE